MVLINSAWFYCVAAIGLVCYLGEREIRKTRESNRPGYKANDRIYKRILPIRPFPNDDEHRASEQAYWIWNIKSQQRSSWVSGFTASAAFLAAVGGYFTFKETRRQADIARDSLIYTNRAWLDVSVDEKSVSMTFSSIDNGSWYINVPNIVITNIGNSPAVKSFTSSDISVDTINRPIGVPPQAADLSRFCKSLDRINHSQVTIFPKHEDIRSISNTVKKLQVESWIDGVKDATNNSSNTIIPLYYSVCSVYHVLGDDTKLHHTGYIFSVESSGIDPINHGLYLGAITRNLTLAPGNVHLKNEELISYID